MLSALDFRADDMSVKRRIVIVSDFQIDVVI